MIDIKTDLEVLQKQIEQFKTNYQTCIHGTITQNPDITVLSTKPRCFVLPFSKLSIESWSPEYYDFELQASILIGAIKQLSIERIDSYFKYIIKNGTLPNTKIMDGDNVLFEGNYSFKLNPKVVAQLKGILN